MWIVPLPVGIALLAMGHPILGALCIGQFVLNVIEIRSY